MLKGEGFYALLLIRSGNPRAAMCPTPDKYCFINGKEENLKP